MQHDVKFDGRKDGRGFNLSFLCRPSEGTDEQFEDLEVLMLDDNKLSSGVFHSLANFKRSL